MSNFRPKELLKEIRNEEKLICERGDTLFSMIQLSEGLRDKIRKNIHPSILNQGLRAIIAYLEAF